MTPEHMVYANLVSTPPAMKPEVSGSGHAVIIGLATVGINCVNKRSDLWARP